MSIYVSTHLDVDNEYHRELEISTENGDAFYVDVDFRFSHIRTNHIISAYIVVTEIMEPVDGLYEPQYLSTNVSLDKQLLIDDHEFVINQDTMFKEFCSNLVEVFDYREDKNIELLKADKVRKLLKTVLKYTVTSVYGIV